jgi:hypothetical protein
MSLLPSHTTTAPTIVPGTKTSLVRPWLLLCLMLVGPIVAAKRAQLTRTSSFTLFMPATSRSPLLGKPWSHPPDTASWDSSDVSEHC